MTTYTFHQDQDNIDAIVELGTSFECARIIANFALLAPCYPGADYDKSLVHEYIGTTPEAANEYYNNLSDEEALSEAALALDAGLWSYEVLAVALGIPTFTPTANKN